MAETPLLTLEALGILLLAIASLVGILTRRLRLPYTVGLVLVGLALSLVPQLSIQITPELILQLRDFQLTPELILGLLVPPLIFEAAFHLNIGALRRNLITILAFAIPGVILTTFLVGGLVSWGAQIPFPAAILFGSLVAATDPVAVIALFRSIGVPKRLQVLLEGESLLNDGTAIVIFTLASEIVVLGEFDIFLSLAEFVRISGGGLAVGILLGYLTSLVFRRIDAPLIETTLTLVLAYGSYLVAEGLHVSGVLAVVSAGLLNGNLEPRRMSPTSRVLVFNFWEIAAFFANSFIFLLIGLEIEFDLLFSNWQAILVAIVAVLIARAVVIFGLSWTGRDIPRNWNPVLYWGGLRGAISLALALSLPTALGILVPQLKAMAFGVVLFTLVVQGVTMERLVDRFKVISRSEVQTIYEARNARLIAARAAYNRLLQMHAEGLISDRNWQSLSILLQKHTDDLVDSVNELLASNPQVEVEELNNARLEALRTQRSILSNLMTEGMISDEIYTQLISEVDIALEAPDNPLSRLLLPDYAEENQIDLMAAAVIQDRDAQKTARALRQAGFMTTQLPSTGGFLGRRNVTMLIGLARGSERHLVEILEANSRSRANYVVNPFEDLRIPIGSPKKVTVGGATLFTIDIEDYREF